ncbi:phosphonate C-P lyase system protein PhnG (plasmid) [Skermanella mucosa]|uniref:phosphonate C-P lyase system protein PhnG n=1 Tax=Skermanella mucosa TaxID=1789672 RepID=UPI00192BAA2F|nr:phosphonate C-P lyase system protein PhnG [Skermanella mucosa]UEM24194.1 phosphonate C-P lyase system protein PhnG [Skermanella mucosa]
MGQSGISERTDGLGSEGPVPAETVGRQRAIAAFASASGAWLDDALTKLGDAIPEALPVRGPEVGLVMLRGRIGGGGSPFNLGEATVTRASVRLSSGEVGHAIVLGRDTAKAGIAAHLDALWQRDDWRDRIEANVVGPAIAAEAAADRVLAEETAATRVDFFTMARGED